MKATVSSLGMVIFGVGGGTGVDCGMGFETGVGFGVGVGTTVGFGCSTCASCDVNWAGTATGAALSIFGVGAGETIGVVCSGFVTATGMTGGVIGFGAGGGTAVGVKTAGVEMTGFGMIVAGVGDGVGTIGVLF